MADLSTFMFTSNVEEHIESTEVGPLPALSGGSEAVVANNDRFEQNME